MDLASLFDAEFFLLIRGGYYMKIGRNEPCPCGSGKKYKKCCLNKTDEQRLAEAVVNSTKILSEKLK